MKRRIHKIANFFAFNLLFFALYLNFIHKDKAVSLTAADQTSVPADATVNSNITVLVKNPEKYLEQKAALSHPEGQTLSSK